MSIKQPVKDMDVYERLCVSSLAITLSQGDNQYTYFYSLQYLARNESLLRPMKHLA